MKPLVLMFEDDPDIAELYRHALTSLGMKVVWFPFPPDNVDEVVAQQRPDLISLDITMPNMDGFSVAERLKKNSRTRSILFVFLTNLSDSATRSTGMTLGAKEYFIKSATTPSVFAESCQVLLAMNEKKHRA